MAFSGFLWYSLVQQWVQNHQSPYAETHWQSHGKRAFFFSNARHSSEPPSHWGHSSCSEMWLGLGILQMTLKWPKRCWQVQSESLLRRWKTRQRCLRNEKGVLGNHRECRLEGKNTKPWCLVHWGMCPWKRQRSQKEHVLVWIRPY